MPFVSAFVISILCAACFVFLVMQQQYTSNRLAFEKEIPFVIKLLSDAVNSGLSLYQAFDIILNDIQGPAHKIFQTILYKKKLGMSFSKIIKFEEENIQIKEFSLFCSAININEETGGSLRKVMNRLEYILSSRKKLKQKMAIAISESKSNGYMVIGIYSALMAYMAYSQPIFLPFFFFDEFGQKLGLVVLGLATLNISAIQYTVYMIKHQK
ncbi:MAG: type II secretion system F family protein [Alphaproteobacteria bacterium]|nr:type II secretion system F family protein [Alphaproteobacteria bacterium]